MNDGWDIDDLRQLFPGEKPTAEKIPPPLSLDEVMEVYSKYGHLAKTSFEEVYYRRILSPPRIDVDPEEWRGSFRVWDGNMSHLTAYAHEPLPEPTPVHVAQWRSMPIDPLFWDGFLGFLLELSRIIGF